MVGELRESLDRWDTVILYLLSGVVVGVLLSPQFTPPSTFGPAGILRADQILIPILVVACVLVFSDRFIVPVSPSVITLVTVPVVIALSSVVRSIGAPIDVGDFFDVVIWCTYATLLFVAGGNLGPKFSRHVLNLLLVTSGSVALLALLQAFGNQFVVETISPIFTHGAHLNVVVQRPTGTTTNPNVLASLLAIPWFLALALLYREVASTDRRVSIQRLVTLIGYLGFLGMTIVSTDSRSGLLTLGIGVGCSLVLLLLSDVGNRTRRLSIIGSSVVVGIGLIAQVLGMDRYSKLISPLDAPSLEARFQKWEEIFPLVLDRPFLGYGPSNEAATAVGVGAIDSGILEWTFHYGLIGLAAIVLFAIATLTVASRTVTSGSLFREQPEVWTMGVAVFGWLSGSLVVWSVLTVFQNRRVFTLFVVLLSLLIAGLVGRGSEDGDRSTGR